MMTIQKIKMLKFSDSSIRHNILSFSVGTLRPSFRHKPAICLIGRWLASLEHRSIVSHRWKRCSLKRSNQEMMTSSSLIIFKTTICSIHAKLALNVWIMNEVPPHIPETLTYYRAVLAFVGCRSTVRWWFGRTVRAPCWNASPVCCTGSTPPMMNSCARRSADSIDNNILAKNREGKINKSWMITTS